MDVTEHIVAVLIGTFGVNPAAVGDDVPMRRLGMDSLALEELRTVLEGDLGIDLEDVQITSRDTFGQLAQTVHGKTGAGA